MLEYRKGRPEDAEAIIDLANLVFSHAHCPHDFPTLLPKLFSAENFVPEYHYIAVDDGRIRACIGSYPNEQVICGRRLRSRDIGTVSVHPYARREGHMRKLMAMVQDDITAEKADLSWLGGQRQRYGYWGYERVGVRTVFSVSRTNARHVLPGREPVWELRELGRDDSALLEAKALHDRQAAHFVRANFYDVLRNWKNIPFGFFDADGRLCGYAVTNADGTDVTELVLAEGADVHEAILALLSRSERFVISVSPWQEDLARVLYNICEDYRIESNEQCRVNCFENVLNAAFALRSLMSDAALIPDTVFEVSIPETNEQLRIMWAGGRGEASAVDALSKDALVLTRKEAETLFFAPVSLIQKRTGIPAGAAFLFPVPLTVPSPDAV